MNRSKASKHYRRIVDAYGTQEERREDETKARRPMGFTYKPYQQPYALPSTWIEEPSDD